VVITFLSDFGLQDDFVGTCHGVMKRLAPQVEIIDITHGIPPQHVLQGALVLCNTLPYMPEGVHLAVIDPGVGGHRRPLALRTEDGRMLVGPDNGLLIPAAERLGGVNEAHELANPEYALDTVSRTFHGRDLFSPAAAHLALEVGVRRDQKQECNREPHCVPAESCDDTDTGQEQDEWTDVDRVEKRIAAEVQGAHPGGIREAPGKVAEHPR